MRYAQYTRRACTTTIMILVMLLLSAMAVLADRATYVSGNSIRVSMISQDPDPVGPGEYLELRWMITNYGSTPVEDLEFQLMTDYPFQLLGSDDGIRNLGTIQGHQKGEEGVILYYRIRINEDASEGVNDLTLKYRHKRQSWTELDEFEIRVQSVDAAVVVDSIKLEPERITPGNNGKLNIKLKNLADSLMKDVNVKLDLTLSTIPRSATGTESAALFEALPFAPTSSSGEKRIQSIKPGKTEIVTFDLMAYPDATSRVYKLPIILTYKDELDNEFTKNIIIGVIVGAEPDLYVVIDSSDLIAGKKNGEVSFKFVNRGVTDIKFLDVILEDTEDYSVVSARKEYIGNIDSDDFESVEFDIYLNNNNTAETKSNLEFPIHITFKDANNKDYEKEISLEYRIHTAEEKGEAKSRSAVMIVVAVIVILAVWVGYRKWEKRRRAKLKKQ